MSKYIILSNKQDVILVKLDRDWTQAQTYLNNLGIVAGIYIC